MIDQLTHLMLPRANVMLVLSTNVDFPVDFIKTRLTRQTQFRNKIRCSLESMNSEYFLLPLYVDVRQITSGMFDPWMETGKIP
jgi:hypothetical protein